MAHKSLLEPSRQITIGDKNDGVHKKSSILDSKKTSQDFFITDTNDFFVYDAKKI